jgi:hypothetical protein
MAHGIPLGQWSGSDAVNELHATIRQFTDESAKQTRRMISLTYVIVLVALLTLVGQGVQLWRTWTPVSLPTSAASALPVPTSPESLGNI